MEYNETEARLLQMKLELQSQFNMTLTKYILNSDKNTATEISTDNNGNTDVKAKKIVLPASKLKPLPPDYVTPVPSMSKTSSATVQTLVKELLNKNSKGTFTLNQNAEMVATPNKDSKVDISTEEKKDIDSNKVINTVHYDTKVGKKNQQSTPTLTIDATLLNQNSVASILNPVASNSVQNSNKPVPVLPKNFLDSALLTKLSMMEESNKTIDNNDILPENDVDNVNENNEGLIEIIPSNIETFENDNEEPMEIDEDCSKPNDVPKTTSAEISKILQNVQKVQNGDTIEKTNEQLFSISFDEGSLAESSKDENEATSQSDSDQQKYVIGKVEIVDETGQELDEADDEDTILMEQDEDGSIIRVVSGKKLIYENNQISLLIPQDASDVESENKDEGGTKNDGPDSNEDDSQIELQVSGDEETANAIIAAAKEQGYASKPSYFNLLY
ncbi:hypothetical protein EVAR_89638_1 [Eumeta japonica]|uniref:Uncharacterized protein n=1 Tax=Eumeta variegata TaxID=151549 RepID=A0A4C1Z5P1_EUMVA|nr:hypothetical protein EVAR_89638_1 [Eumeta japonica]